MSGNSALGPIALALVLILAFVGATVHFGAQAAQRAPGDALGQAVQAAPPPARLRSGKWRSRKQAPPAAAAEKPSPSLEEFQRWLEEYVPEQSGTYGIHVRHLESGAEAGVNADAVFPAASTFKLPLALYVLEQVKQGAARFDEVLTYQDGDWEDGAGVLQASQAGETYTVGELLEVAIVHSDNIAANMLLRRFDHANVWAFMQSLGATEVFDGEYSVARPRDLVTYMQYLVQLPQDDPYRKLLLDLLGRTTFTGGFLPGIPEGVGVAHKYGALPGAANDVAVVFAPDHTLIIAVMSKDVDLDEAFEDVMPAIAREAYQRVAGHS